MISRWVAAAVRLGRPDQGNDPPPLRRNHREDLVRQGADDPEIMADEEISEAVAGCNSRSNSTICACTDMSSAEVGSSSTTKRGFNRNARAIAMRWR
jgi:hypothetical protein